ncbi:MAG TPA: serine hydrolase domain-containing protein [Longimicrobiales bacterium]|nr:serine hydrolase domain-containing protein [Longimicrobiales bacterium]
MRVRPTLLLGLLLAVGACAPDGRAPETHDDAPPPELFPELDREIEGWVEAGDVVGAELLVLRDGETLHHRAYGWKDREAGVPMRTDGIHTIASMTKPVTALAVLMLVEEGSLALDQPVAELLPGFTGDPRTTVADLLSHTSGDAGDHGDAGSNVYDFPTLDAWVADWAGSEHTGEHGRFQYSNFNYAALAWIAEQASGVPFEDFVTLRILAPLGMNDSSVRFSPDSSWADRVPTAYTWSDDTDRFEPFWTPDEPQRWAFFPGAFGLWSTTRDYAKFLTMWMDLGEAGGERLISPETARAALTPKAWLDDLPLIGYAWFLDGGDPDGGLPKAFYHTGGWGTLGMALPGDRGVVVFLSQSMPEPFRAQEWVLRNRIQMSGLFDDPGPEMRRPGETDVEPIPQQAERLAEYEGVYRAPLPWAEGATLQVRVSVEDGVLQLEQGRQASTLAERVHLVPVGDDRFLRGRYADGRLVGVDPEGPIRFQREGDRVTAIETGVLGPGEPVVRVEVER